MLIWRRSIVLFFAASFASWAVAGKATPPIPGPNVCAPLICAHINFIMDSQSDYKLIYPSFVVEWDTLRSSIVAKFAGRGEARLTAELVGEENCSASAIRSGREGNVRWHFVRGAPLSTRRDASNCRKISIAVTGTVLPPGQGGSPIWTVWAADDYLRPEGYKLGERIDW